MRELQFSPQKKRRNKIMEFRAYHSGSKGNLYSIESESSTLLIDPGVSYSRIVSKIDLTNVYGALVSHSHGDHCKAVHKLLERGIPCYASVATMQALDRNTNKCLQLEAIVANQQFEIANFKIKAFDVKHDAPGTMGFLVQDRTDKLLYVTDTPYITPRFKNVTIMAIECNHSDEAMSIDDPELEIRIRNNHMNLKETIRLLKSQNLERVKEIWLLHLSDSNSHADNFIKTVQRETGKPVYVA